MRIVAGEFKGHKLEGPVGKSTRPTSDKVREALFSILGDVEGMRVLDLFAGTGAVGIEALSRGAESAMLIERDGKMAGVAARNVLAILGKDAPRAELARIDAVKYLARAPQFDLVFIDPPYADAAALAPKLIAALPAALAPGATVVTESDRRSPLDLTDSQLSVRSEHIYGDTLIRVFDSP